ncbi:MAG: SMI1/KNR4 family protein [Planctomycetota bacterium]
MASAIRDVAASRADLNSNLNFGPIDDLLICDAEAELGAKFPPDFRNYLLEFAGGLLLGWELYGIQSERSVYPPELDIPGNQILDIVEQNRLMQNPAGVLEFTNDGGGFFFAFIPDRDPNAVFVRGYGADWAKLYPSFHDFLGHIADDSIGYPA